MVGGSKSHDVSEQFKSSMPINIVMQAIRTPSDFQIAKYTLVTSSWASRCRGAATISKYLPMRGTIAISTIR